MESMEVMDAGPTVCEGRLLQFSDNARENVDLGDGLLDDLDSYLQDINDRLTISRMVGDSVIKGMVNAVSQEAVEKISRKESEVTELKDVLQFYHDFYYSSSEAFPESDKVRQSLGSLQNTTTEQFKKLRRAIDSIRGCSISRTNSSSDLIGLSGVLQEKVSEKWTDVDRETDSLQAILSTSYKRVEDMINLTKTSVCQWQVEQKFKVDIEDMVFKTCINDLQKEFEERWWNQNAQIFSDVSVNWIEKIKDISSLRQELDAVSQSLALTEAGQLTPHGSFESDHLPRKLLSNHLSPSTLLWEENGKHDESKINIPENLDPSRLKHLSRDELISYYNSEMTKLRRNHESQVQLITEENFGLKRELLKERGSLLSQKKDKEFDMLRKKIPDVILKLDELLVENEKLAVFGNEIENLGNFRDRMETFLSENQKLRDLLAEKGKEIKCLSAQVSNATEELSKYSLSQVNLLKTIEKLECEVQDANIEFSVCEEIYKCFLRALKDQIRYKYEESDLEYDIMQGIYEIIFTESIRDTDFTSNLEIEDSDMESIIMQGVLGAILGEVLKDAEEKLNNLDERYISESNARISLELDILEKDEALRLMIAEKEGFKQEIFSLTSSIEEKEKLVQELSAALQKERQQLESASQELGYLKDQINQQQILIFESNKESAAVKGDLADAVEQIELLKLGTREINQKLERAMKELKEVEVERAKLLSLVEENRIVESSMKAKEREYREQMGSNIIFIQELLNKVSDFECRVTEYISRNSLRLKSLSSQSSVVIQEAKILRRTGLRYKQKFERKCSDLQKAEAEVDLLGDEVETLLGLLEKIYIALDHYSPILKHYPGVVEILKLVRRELSAELIGDSTKSV